MARACSRSTSFGFGAQPFSAPPTPSVANVSEALPVAIQGRLGRKYDLRHASSHVGRKRVKPMPDRPPGTDRECTGQQCGGISDDNAALRLLGDAGRCDRATGFIAPTELVTRGCKRNGVMCKWHPNVGVNGAMMATDNLQRHIVQGLDDDDEPRKAIATGQSPEHLQCRH